MPLSVQFKFAVSGNTVPYPANSKGVRTNAGFFDLRGRPEMVKEIHEARQSPELTGFLTQMAIDDRWISLGCDVGGHLDSGGTYYAGGYVQFARNDFALDYDFYKELAETLYCDIEEYAGREDWLISLEIGDMIFKLDGNNIETASLLVWFDAGDATVAGAKASRERLIGALTSSLFDDCGRAAAMVTSALKPPRSFLR